MIIDLTMEIYDRAPTFDEDPVCSIQRHCTIEQAGSTCSQISISSHHGTHMDAPLHFLPDGGTIDQISLDDCIGEAFLIDFSWKKAFEPIGIEDFQPYTNQIQEGSRIVYRTGFDEVYPEGRYFTDFPYLTMEAADWLAAKNIALLGMDTPTPNPVDYTYVHRALLQANVRILEGLANLASIRRGIFYLAAAPLKIRDCDAAPVRAYAIL